MQFQDILEERGIFHIYMMTGSSSHQGMGMSQDHTGTPEPLS